jgi:hypothetical protein
MSQITVFTNDQRILLECELKGQISDGYWENSKPYDHYKQPCKSTVVVDPNNIGMDFFPSRKYNFSAPSLLEVVGERMRMFVLISRLYPTLSIQALRLFDYGEWVWEPARIDYAKQLKELAVIGITSYAQMQSVCKSLDMNSYPNSELKTDLNQLKVVFKTIK